MDEVSASLKGLIQTTDLLFHFPSHPLLIKRNKEPFWLKEITGDGDKVEPCSGGLRPGTELP